MRLRCCKTPDIRTGLAPFFIYRCDPWEPFHSQIAQLGYTGDQQPWAEGSVMKSKRNTELGTSGLNWAMLQWLGKSVPGIEKDSKQFFEYNGFVSQSWRKGFHCYAAVIYYVAKKEISLSSCGIFPNWDNEEVSLKTHNLCKNRQLSQLPW